MSINNGEVIGKPQKNLILETAGKLYVKVNEHYYEIDFRNLGNGNEKLVGIPQIAPSEEQDSAQEIDLSEYVTNSELKKTLKKYVTERSWQDVKDTQAALENAMIEGFTESIKPITIQTMQIAVGTEQYQFDVINSFSSDVRDNYHNYYPLYIDSTTGELTWEPCYIKHYTLDGPTSVQSGNLKEYWRWYITNSHGGGTKEPIYLDNNTYYIYLKVPYLSTSESSSSTVAGSFAGVHDDNNVLQGTGASVYVNNGTLVTPTGKGLYAKTGVGTIVCSEEAKEFESYENGITYYYLLYAIVTNSDGEPSIATMNGYTEILPGQITAYLFKSPTGSSYLDLKNNTFVLGNDENNPLLAFNKNNSGALYLRGAIIQDDGGNVSYVPVNRGVYIPQTSGRPASDWTYYPGDVVQYTDSAGTTSSYQYIYSSSGYSPLADWPATDTTHWRIYASGTQGRSAPLVSLRTTSYVFSYDSEESPSPRENSITLTCDVQNIDSPSYTWYYRNGNNINYTIISGVSSQTLTVASNQISTYFGSNQTCTFKVVCGGLEDTVTIARVYGGIDSISVILTNPSHLFPGSETAATAGSDTFEVLVYKGNTLLSYDNYTLSISGTVTGMSASQSTASFNNTTVRTVTVSVDGNLTTLSGKLTVQITVNNIIYKLYYSWALSLTGKTGHGATARVRNWVADGATHYYNGDVPESGTDKYWLDFVYDNVSKNYYRCKVSDYVPASGASRPGLDSQHWVLESSYKFIASSVLFAGTGSDGWVMDAGQIYHTGNKAKLDADGAIFLGNTNTSVAPTTATANFSVDTSGNVKLKGDIEISDNHTIRLLDSNTTERLKISSTNVDLYPRTTTIYSNNSINLQVSGSATYVYRNSSWILTSGKDHYVETQQLGTVFLNEGSKVSITYTGGGTTIQPGDRHPESVENYQDVYLKMGSTTLYNNAIVPSSGTYTIYGEAELKCNADDGGWYIQEETYCNPSGWSKLETALITETIYNAEDQRIVMGTNGMNIMLGAGTYIQATTTEADGSVYPEICLRTKDYINANNSDGWYIKIGRNGIRFRDKGMYYEANLADLINE